MKIGLLTLQFRLNACHSLKEKRGRLRRLKDKYGRIPNIAVCESDFHDSLQQAQWSFIAIANDKKIVERSLGKIADEIALSIDAMIVEQSLEYM